MLSVPGDGVDGDRQPLQLLAANQQASSDLLPSAQSRPAGLPQERGRGCQCQLSRGSDVDHVPRDPARESE